MKEIVSQKIRQGRILNALSLQDLANLIGVSKQMISKYERGESMPTSKLLLNLAKSLGVNMDYFFKDSTVELGSVTFRKRKNLSIKKVNALKEAIKIKLANYLEIENILQINNYFENPLKRIKANSLEDVALIVHELRNEWEIGLDPIHNIIQILEDKEIKVFEIDEPENNFDGLATIINTKYPVIVINKNFNVERKRFTLLHELGHLLLELPVGDSKLEESICNRFAAELLFPNNSVLKEFGTSRDVLSLSELIAVQMKYGLSIKAVVYRLRDAGILSASRVVGFYKKLNDSQHLMLLVDKERFKTPEESRRFEQLVYRALSQELISSSKAASLLNVNINQVSCALI